MRIVLRVLAGLVVFALLIGGGCYAVWYRGTHLSLSEVAQYTGLSFPRDTVLEHSILDTWPPTIYRGDVALHAVVTMESKDVDQLLAQAGRLGGKGGLKRLQHSEWADVSAEGPERWWAPDEATRGYRVRITPTVTNGDSPLLTILTGDASSGRAAVYIVYWDL